jgi:hypothetical protein
MLTRIAKETMVSFRLTPLQEQKVIQAINATKPSGLNGAKEGETSIGLWSRKLLLDFANDQILWRDELGLAPGQIGQHRGKAAEMYLPNRADTETKVKRRKPSKG